jgi:polyisoprenoid-binding protein YceI
MKKTNLLWLTFLMLSAVLLAACGSPTQSVATEAPKPTGASAATNAPAEASPEPDQPADSPAGELVFRILPQESEARFGIDEVLAGSPNHVVGTTNDVQGEIRVDPGNPADATVGTITIGADSLATDNNFRNRAIANFILHSGDFPVVTFTPTEISGLPDSAAVGDRLNFQISGDLQVRDITQPVTFDLTVEVESPTRISGTAQATIQRADFDLQIPSVPQVASVSERVLLELYFVAESGS